MAVYVFQCQDCHHEFSVMTSWTKKAEVTCPQCGSANLKEQWGQYRLLTAGASDGAGSSGCAPGGG